MPAPLTGPEKAIYDTLLNKAQAEVPKDQSIYLVRMTLDGRDVAVVGCDVFNAFTGKAEGMMPLALVLTQDDPILKRLRDINGGGSVTASPHDLDPTR